MANKNKKKPTPTKNPWAKAAKEWYRLAIKGKGRDYVLEEDWEIIREFNKDKKAEHKIHTDRFPSPFFGNIKKAKLLLLMINPGVSISPGLETSIEARYHSFLDKKMLRKHCNWVRQNLSQENGMEYPFVPLNLELEYSGMFRYWAGKVFKNFLNSPEDYKTISDNVCCVEYFPYASKSSIKSIYEKFNKSNAQQYSFDIVKYAMFEKRHIIIMRHEEEWFDRLKKLKTYKRCFFLTSRNATLSQGNLTNGHKDVKKIARLLGVEAPPCITKKTKRK